MLDEKLIGMIADEVARQLKARGILSADSSLSHEAARETDGTPAVDIASAQHKAKPLLKNAADPEALSRMKRRTTARIGVGRAGPRLNTETMLTLRADHAKARDSVFADVDPALLERMGLFAVQTLCDSKDAYLTRPDPAEVRSGLEAAVRCVEQEASFYSADAEDSVVYFAHCISRTGSYLSKEAGVPEGTAMAYLIAPPSEAVMGLDAALKAADVELRLFYGPPTETNFAGGLLTGDQAACLVACKAFADKVCEVAENPVHYQS